MTFFVATFNFNLIFAAGTSFVDSNEHKSKVLQRQKRFLIFNNGGVAKFISKCGLCFFVENLIQSFSSMYSWLFGSN